MNNEKEPSRKAPDTSKLISRCSLGDRIEKREKRGGAEGGGRLRSCASTFPPRLCDIVKRGAPEQTNEKLKAPAIGKGESPHRYLAGARQRPRNVGSRGGGTAAADPKGPAYLAPRKSGECCDQEAGNSTQECTLKAQPKSLDPSTLCCRIGFAKSGSIWPPLHLLRFGKRGRADERKGEDDCAHMCPYFELCNFDIVKG